MVTLCGALQYSEKLCLESAPVPTGDSLGRASRMSARAGWSLHSLSLKLSPSLTVSITTEHCAARLTNERGAIDLGEV